MGKKRIGCGGDTNGILVGGTERGGRGDGWDGDGDGDRLSRLEDNVEQVTLGTDHDSPLAYSLGLEHPPDYEYAWGERKPVIDIERKE